MRRTPRRFERAGVTGGRHWKIALCSLSIGQQRRAAGAHRGDEHAARRAPAFPCWRAGCACPPAPRRASGAAPPRRRSPPRRCRLRGSVATSHNPCAPLSTRVGRPSRFTAAASSPAACASSNAAYGGRNRAICSSSGRHCRLAASAATAKRSGCRAMTSSVDAPIEPVAPRRVMLRKGWAALVIAVRTVR